MSDRPNILHLFTDQQRFDTIAALGNPIIRTPHLDRLVREGTVFQRAYSPSPECVPARCSMITGAYPGRTGCYSNEQAMVSEELPTLMSRLTDAGYRTHGVGKCHFTPNSHALRGFETRQIQEEMPLVREKDDYARWLVEKGWGEVLEPHGVRGEMYYIPQPSVLPEACHPSRWVGDQALDFLDEGSDRPWYLFASFIQPHPPFSPPSPWHKLYRASQMPLPDIPENRDNLLAFINHFQNRYKYRDRGMDENLIRCLRAYYYACISFIDVQVGRILARLEETGALDDTLILFSSDHGEYLGDFGCFGKRGIHDVSSRIPMVVRWPGGAHAGARCERPVSLVDLAPTFLEAAGIPYGSDEFDGVSLRSIWSGEVDRPVVFSQYQHGASGLYMAVNERWKYGYSAADGQDYLFDLDSNPREHVNLAAMAPYHAVLTHMRSTCMDWIVSQGQTDALNGDNWRAYPKQTMPEDPDEGLIFQDPPWWDGKLPTFNDSI